jgi:hypothetical protein
MKSQRSSRSNKSRGSNISRGSQYDVLSNKELNEELERALEMKDIDQE